MKVKLDDIPETGKNIDEALPKAFVDALLPRAQALRAETPGHAVLRLTRHEDNVLVDGKAEIHIAGECASCLTELHQTIKTKVSMLLVPAGTQKTPDEEETEVSADDDGVGEYKDKQIDWGDVVQQHLLTALPIAPRCKDDCKGLCPVCGVDKNVEACTCVTKQMDPRWEKLKEIKL